MHQYQAETTNLDKEKQMLNLATSIKIAAEAHYTRIQKLWTE